MTEESQRAPSLMRQCRVAIRRQLSVASHHRTILPAIDQLPLPSRLKQYLKFEGPLTEIDLGTEDQNYAKEATNIADGATDIGEGAFRPTSSPST